GVAQSLEGDVTRARVVDVWGNGGGARLRPQYAGDEARPVGGAGGIGLGPRNARRGEVHFVGQGLEAVVGLRNGGRPEGIGADDIRARLQILAVDLRNDFRLDQGQQLIVALD